MGKEIRLSLDVTASDPDTFYAPAINGIVNAISFNFSDDYITALGGGDTDITVTENGGANRELVNVTTETDDFVIVPSLAGQTSDGTADGSRQVLGIFDRGLVISIGGTEVVADAIEVVISVID
jgi:hypothetical protein